MRTWTSRVWFQGRDWGHFLSPPCVGGPSFPCLEPHSLGSPQSVFPACFILTICLSFCLCLPGCKRKFSRKEEAENNLAAAFRAVSPLGSPSCLPLLAPLCVSTPGLCPARVISVPLLSLDLPRTWMQLL